MQTITKGEVITSYFHEDGECFVPSWLIDGLKNRLRWYGYTWEDNITWEIGVSLASEITDEATFEVFLSSLHALESSRIRNEMEAAVDRWGEEVTHEFSQQLSRQREMKEKERYCIICTTNYRNLLGDVCGDCKQKYAQEEQRVKAQNYIARSHGLPATLTLGEWINTLNSYQYMCAYCQDKPYKVLEHFIPIAEGGGTTKENCLPSCHACNIKKGSKHPDPRISLQV